MSERTLVVGFTWIDGAVHLRQWKGEADARALRLEPVPSPLCFRVLPQHHCTGYHDGERLLPCPQQAVLARGSTCEGCTARDEFRPCMTCDGTRCPKLTPQMAAYCQQRHHLYLACFGDTNLKVGTASDGRKEQRIVEQGPLAAARVASAEGPVIKRMEHLLVEAGFSETMRRARKTALIRASMSEEEARTLVTDAAGELTRVLPRRYRRYLHAPELVEQPALARQSRRHRASALRLEADRVVEGAVVGAVGHLLFVQDDDGCFSLDLGELRGRQIEWDPAGPRRRATAQLGLF
jgi:hypothetical protein